MYRRVFVFVNPFHARHVRENIVVFYLSFLLAFKPVESMGGSGRGAWPTAEWRPEGVGANRIDRPGDEESLFPFFASKARRLSVFSEAQSIEILCKPN